MRRAAQEALTRDTHLEIDTAHSLLGPEENALPSPPSLVNTSSQPLVTPMTKKALHGIAATSRGSSRHKSSQHRAFAPRTYDLAAISTPVSTSNQQFLYHAPSVTSKRVGEEKR
jgi:hypothetical protein